jgi:hypothetical protein
MEADKLIDGATYGPEALKVIRQAFDEAWTSIAATYGHYPQDIERARLRLARAVLSVAQDGTQTVGQLKVAALQAMALGYKTRDK